MHNLNVPSLIRHIITPFLLLASSALSAQTCYWQQKVQYKIDVSMNTSTNRFNGSEELFYTNNSPDTLKKVFYHLYWNAFQPNSMMDVNDRELMKSDTGFNLFKDNVKNRIQLLKPGEIGYIKIISLNMNGISQAYNEKGTILEVVLSKPILPHTIVKFNLSFEAQVPLEIRRSGRDNPETGVQYSMSQWYPEMCEYDIYGWHPTPYVLREFYGVWGDYDVSISINKKYILGGTGYLQNPEKIGYGYEKPGEKVSRPNTKNLVWHFIAKNVHDFMWAADTAYIHIIRHIPHGPVLHVLYVNHKKSLSFDTSWNALVDAIVTVFPFMEKNFGKYTYNQFSIVQGGDGGMEYPMSCLIANPNIGTAFHEMLHNWYYGLLGTNESLYAWMDEGFTTYAEDLVWDYYLDEFVKANPSNKRAKSIRDYYEKSFPHLHVEQYKNYFTLVKSRLEEPLITHADHFSTRVAYDIGDYAKGAIFLEQLGYIVGADVRDKILLEYYKQWKFKHPNPNDFFRLAEKVSGMQLNWYKEGWINLTKTIDYAIDSVWSENGKTKIQLRNEGNMAMPIDLRIKYKDSTTEIINIPRYLMFGNKTREDTTAKFTVYEPWKWTDRVYTLTLNKAINEILEVEIDPTQRMADINRANNKKILHSKRP